MDAASMLEVYRRDRRRLLGFLLSAGGGGGRALDLSRVDLDAVSADYALECVAAGAQFDASEATRRYFDERRYPIMIGSPSGNSYFLLSRPEPSDSPPKEAAPSIGSQAPQQENSSPVGQPRDFFRDAINTSGIGYGTRDDNLADISPQQVKEVDILSLGLPRLSTELSDDDMRETAYEVLLASLFVSGKVHFSEEKREKKNKFLKGLRTKTEVSNSTPQVEDGYAHILDLIRVQMEDWVVSVPEGRVEVLTIIERYNSKLSALTKKFNLKEETYHWTHNYHVNFRLYEKLLCSVFDILEDGQLVEEADEILETAKLTWPILGITEKLHGIFYAWVLFQKFAQTGETLLLKHASLQIQKLLLHHDIEELEVYTNSFICSADACGGDRALSLADSALLKINSWCRRQLENYHAHFSKKNYSIFEATLNLALLLVKTPPEDDCEEVLLIESPVGSTPESKLVHLLIVRSIHAAYKQALISSDGRSETEIKHPLTILANELKLVAEKECSAFSPILHKYYPEAQGVALIFLHMLYGKQLELFLERTDHLENSKEILAASNNFELFIAEKLRSVYGEAGSSFSNYLKPYMIGCLSSPLILQWLHAQHENVLEWTKRTIGIEDWTPLSVHEKQATSVVEVFRIVEESVDQFFNTSLPLDIVHLRSLLIGITSSLEVYLLHMENQQVSGSTLLPRAPVLTRYAESMNPFAKRKLIEPTVPEEKVATKLNNLTVPKLCVKLNTLQFIRDQLDAIEEGIKRSWISVLSGNPP
uniref:MHD1 domain-containing protein n=2 Tax=Setaria italica TaxID=4555 RepID=K3Y5E8_SETIT